MSGSKVLTRNTIVGDRIYPAGTPVSAIPARSGFAVETMVTQARVAPGPELEVDPNLDLDTPPALPIERLKLSELQELAAARGIELPQDATRKQIIAVLEAAG